MTTASTERPFQLLGTSACHLCEQAADMLLALQAAGMDFRFEHVDISGDDALFARYGLLIPVLRAPDGRELHWPFEADALATFLRRQEPVRLGGS